jgi:hypothetical protein
MAQQPIVVDNINGPHLENLDLLRGNELVENPQEWPKTFEEYFRTCLDGDEVRWTSQLMFRWHLNHFPVKYVQIVKKYDGPIRYS